MTEINNLPEIQNRNTTIKTREAFDYALGSVLGDGSIHNTKGQLVIDQSVKAYTIWKYKEAARLGLATPISEIEFNATPETKRQRKDLKTGKVTSTVSYRRYTLGLFKSWRSIFYTLKVPTDPTYGRGNSKYRKKIPDNIFEWFTSPYSLAIFYMDDGCFVDNSALFRTGEIPVREVKMLQQALKLNFDLESTIQNKEDQPASIYVRRCSWEKFKQLVEPTISQVPEMTYKLGKL